MTSRQPAIEHRDEQVRDGNDQLSGLSPTDGVPHPEADELPDGGPGRGESPWKRLDRNTIELINELRVAGTGIQVLFAFLLIVPFNNRFTRLSRFDRDIYFVALVCIAIAAIMLIAPSIHHRLLFRLQQKEYLVETGNKMLIVGAAFLAVGLTAILVLISNLIFGSVAAVIMGTAAGCGVATLWFAMPLARRRSLRQLTGQPRQG